MMKNPKLLWPCWGREPAPLPVRPVPNSKLSPKIPQRTQCERKLQGYVQPITDVLCTLCVFFLLKVDSFFSQNKVVAGKKKKNLNECTFESRASCFVSSAAGWRAPWEELNRQQTLAGSPGEQTRRKHKQKRRFALANNSPVFQKQLSVLSKLPRENFAKKRTRVL